MFIHIVYNNTVKEEFKPFEGTISFIGPKADEWTYPSTMKLDELPEPQKSIYIPGLLRPFRATSNLGWLPKFTLSPLRRMARMR